MWTSGVEEVLLSVGPKVQVRGLDLGFWVWGSGISTGSPMRTRKIGFRTEQEPLKRDPSMKLSVSANSLPKTLNLEGPWGSGPAVIVIAAVDFLNSKKARLSTSLPP